MVPQNDENAIRWLPVRSQAKAALEVQTLTIGGGPTGGTFTLTYGGQTTGGIAFNAGSAAVQTALQGLSSVGSSNATVSGGAGGPYTVTFGGTIGGKATALTASGAGLTGGSSPSVTPAATGEGDALPYAVLMVTGTDTDGCILVNRPTADGISPAFLLLNGPGLLVAGKDGQANAASPALALYDTADGTPAVSDPSWGSGAGTYKLKRDNSGFKIHGNADDGVVLVARESGCVIPGGTGGTITDHVSFIGTDCSSNTDVQTDLYFGCPLRAVVTPLGTASCCTTVITMTTGNVQHITLNGAGSDVPLSDGDSISFDIGSEVPTKGANNVFAGVNDFSAQRLINAADPVNPQDVATKHYADSIGMAGAGMVFKGSIDCSANPNYPAADRGWTYRVSVAGKIGGASGIVVEAGDIAICLDDGTASGNQATVGSHWTVAQANIDGAVIGPVSATDTAFALFDGASGKLIKDGFVTVPDGRLSSNVPLKDTNDTFTASITIAQAAGTGAQSSAFTITGAAHTALTASTEYSDLDINLNRTVQFATGTVGNQRAIHIRPPTYAFVAASTITNATTVDISGPPNAGTNCTITNNWSLVISGGNLGVTGKLLVATSLVTPDAAALLQADSTTQGFLPPRMTTTQRTAISSPPEGLVVYNTTTHKLSYYNGTAWVDLGGITGTFVDAATGDTLTYTAGQIASRATGSLTTQVVDTNVVMDPTTCIVSQTTVTLHGVFTVT